MTQDHLKRANQLQEEIRELDYFIFRAGCIWKGKIIKRDEKYIFKANGYGAFDDCEYNLNTEMKNRVLDVLKKRLKELKEELESL